MNIFRSFLLGSIAAIGTCVVGHAASASPAYSHVLLLSVDGMHAVDLQNYLADPAHADSALMKLSKHGVMYPNALTTGPSDSFPGMIGQVTGATAKSAGEFYDDHFDRELWAAGSNCQGPAGTEFNAAEPLDRNQNRYDAGGILGKPYTQIDPAKLPVGMRNGKCVPFYPHMTMRVNTVFEVLHKHGRYTAWSDKHPAYEILNGPSGHGINDLFTPEINSLFPGSNGGDNTKSYRATRHYDDTKVQAVLNEIDGLNSTGTSVAPVPAILGMNFQALSVAQKLAKSGPTDPPGLTGGYKNENATPGNAVSEALAFVDSSLQQMIDELKAQGIYDQTLIIVSAKHGQSPIDRAVRTTLDDSPFNNVPGAAFHIADDVLLLWLTPQIQTTGYDAARAWLNTHGRALGIVELLDRTQLSVIYEDPFKPGSATPDFIGVTKHGLIYTTGSKLAEHGGFSNDDRNVAMLVSAPRLPSLTIESPVQTIQIAPTILKALGVDPSELVGVKIEGTQVLPNIF